MKTGKKVCILDWDIHVGDGTYKIFEDYADVLTISTHRHDNGTYWPFGNTGSHTNIGKGEGEGMHLLLGLSGKNGDHEFKAMFDSFIKPIITEFGPELLIVSSGFDSAMGDPLGVTFEITPEGYSYLTGGCL